MKFFRIFILSVALIIVFPVRGQSKRFDKSKDLLLAQFDCKTDVDDLHTVAALASLLQYEEFQGIDYHAVAGAYGIQKGLYVPPNELFQLAFQDRWSDAHSNPGDAVSEVLEKVTITLSNGGNVWVADAGQSDFSARWIQALVAEHPELSLKDRIHIVQHSDWNEEVTKPEYLAYVKTNANYHKIPDGNTVGNGTPGFRSDAVIAWKEYITNAGLRQIWEMAIRLGNRYNGKEGRYLNKSIANGGLDFSDLSEVCYIFNLDLKDGEAFFTLIK